MTFGLTYRFLTLSIHDWLAAFDATKSAVNFVSCDEYKALSDVIADCKFALNVSERWITDELRRLYDDEHICAGDCVVDGSEKIWKCKKKLKVILVWLIDMPVTQLLSSFVVIICNVEFNCVRVVDSHTLLAWMELFTAALINVISAKVFCKKKLIKYHR